MPQLGKITMFCVSVIQMLLLGAKQAWGADVTPVDAIVENAVSHGVEAEGDEV
jgi:hypothetical protein